MEILLRFLQRHPPRCGWLLFLMALMSGLLLPVIVGSGRFELNSLPTLLAIVAGLSLPLWGGRRVRPLLLLVALLIPLLLLGLVPPWHLLVDDLRGLISWRGEQLALQLPVAVATASSTTAGTLQAAWQGDSAALSWTIERLSALLAYIAAGILGFGLRRNRFTLGYSLPLLAAQAAIAITTRAGTGYAAFGIFLALVVSLAAGFIARERTWDHAGVGYSEGLRADVLLYGVALLGAVFMLGLAIPAVPRNAITNWIWSDVDLPPGLEALDNRRRPAGDGRIAGRQGGLRPAANLELGTSLEEGGREEIVLRVRVDGLEPDAAPYWRGRIFDSYTGRGWTTGPLETTAISPFEPGQTPTGYIVQQVTDLRGGQRLRYGVADIVAASEAATLEQTTRGEIVGWIGGDSSYTVYSSPPGPLEDIGPEAIEGRRSLQSYTDVPDTLPTRVVETARQLTANGKTQVERALAIENYLRGLKYSYQVEPLPRGGDAVDQFLFTMRAGYCTYYASAMAVMARAVNIPSRVAVGFATGTYNTATREFEVREQDAHAWPELYIEGVGWTRWEPTPVRPVPSRSLQQDRPGVGAPQATTTTVPSRSRPVWPVVIVSGLLLGLAVIGARKLASRPMNPAAVHADLYRRGRRAGVRPAPGDSVEEYASRVSDAAPSAKGPIQRVGRLLTARLYRRAPLTRDEARSLVDAWNDARAILRRERRPARNGTPSKLGDNRGVRRKV